MIRHIVAMPPQVAEGGESYFQGFSTALFPDYLRIFASLTEFPHDVLDLLLDGPRFVLARMAGSGLDVYLLRADLLHEFDIDWDRPLNVIWSAESSVELVEHCLDRFAVRPVHITVGERAGVTSISTLTVEMSNQLVMELLARAAALDAGLEAIAKRLSDSQPLVRHVGPLGLSPRLHNCTAPLIEVLRAYGFDIEDGRPIDPAEAIDAHVEGISELVREVDALRSAVGALPRLRKNDALIFCPSNYTYLYRADSEHWRELYRRLSRDRRNFVKRALIRNRGYSNFTLNIAAGALFNPYEDKDVGPLLAIRQFELSLFTTLISLAAVNQFVPAIRLPNAVMLHHDRLSNIYALVNSTRRDRTQELSRRLADYSKVIQEEIGPILMVDAFQSRQKLLAVCDFPIEWLSIDLLPAMFRFEMSRVPSTPGNVTAHLLMSGQRLLLPLDVISDILILRSFAPSDPIRNHLSDAVSGFSESAGLENLSYRIVDVASEAELIHALNEFRGATVIFDCHGNHGGEQSHAWLMVGHDRVNVWELANRARIPPIVVLAACSTHALDGSHASVANGLLRSGAISVLGTFAPVDAVHTGITVARLMYRISAFIPLVTKRGPRTWREILSGFFRMSYVTDVLREFHHGLRYLSEQQYRDLHLKANIWINSAEPDWFDKLRDGLMAMTNLDQASLESVFRERLQFVDTMLFVQLGRPENILIVDRHAELEEGAEQP